MCIEIMKNILQKDIRWVLFTRRGFFMIDSLSIMHKTHSSILSLLLDVPQNIWGNSESEWKNKACKANWPTMRPH